MIVHWQAFDMIEYIVHGACVVGWSVGWLVWFIGCLAKSRHTHIVCSQCVRCWLEYSESRLDELFVDGLTNDRTSASPLSLDDNANNI